MKSRRISERSIWILLVIVALVSLVFVEHRLNGRLNAVQPMQPTLPPVSTPFVPGESQGRAEPKSADADTVGSSSPVAWVAKPRQDTWVF
ncbi:hypothetical protein [Pseudomonas sp. RIT-PI-AD]|uniref:hypothetical protein n=1 Tax=Pseudomonas sp. RIT-PI-AD TaxID=3035294 RepID=UPI0021DAB019|nr:hypothetical protein [Pseudomonas sp. RIT-PI-AD]